MSDPNQSEPTGSKADEPLSPEALAMFSKARRSFGISIGILLLGFMAIGIALVYRVMRDAIQRAGEQSGRLYDIGHEAHYQALAAVMALKAPGYGIAKVQGDV
jgi:hypothetical protein